MLLEVVAGDTPCAACSIVARHPPKNKKNRFGKELFGILCTLWKKTFGHFRFWQKRLGNNVLAKKVYAIKKQNCFGKNGGNPPSLIQAFKATKTALCDVTLLAHPQANAPLGLFRDASRLAVDAALKQLVTGAWQPLAVGCARNELFSESYGAQGSNDATW